MSRPMNRLRAVVQMLGTLVVLGGLLGGIPLALVQWGHWPITGAPSWDDISDLPNAIVSDEAILAVLTVALWASWALFAASVVAEAVAQFRGRARAPLSLGGPLQRLAGHLIGSLVVCIGSLGSGASASMVLPAAALSQPALPAAGQTVQVAPTAPMPGLVDVDPNGSGHLLGQAWADPGTAAPGGVGADLGHAGAGAGSGALGAADLGSGRALSGADSASLTSGQQQAAPTVAVQRGDSPWSLAETHLGDGKRWREIWELNQSRQQPDGSMWSAPEAAIRPGWELALPTDAGGAGTTPAPSAAPATTTPPAPATPSEPAAQLTVQRGDHFWKLAQDQLTSAWGRVPTDAEIVPHWQALVEANRHLLAPPHDPDLIYPGQVFTLLTPPPDPTRPAPPPPPSEQEEAPADETGTPPPSDGSGSDDTSGTDSGSPEQGTDPGQQDQPTDQGQDETESPPSTEAEAEAPPEEGTDPGQEQEPADQGQDETESGAGAPGGETEGEGEAPPPDGTGTDDPGSGTGNETDGGTDTGSDTGDETGTDAGAETDPGTDAGTEDGTDDGTGADQGTPPEGAGTDQPGSGDQTTEPTSPTTAEAANRESTEEESRLPVGLIGGGLAIAGVVVLLERRRRAQQRHRGRGRGTAMPGGALQDDERMLRGGADVDGARVLDLALRAAAAGSRATGLPPLRWVEATADEVLLVLAAPAPPPRGFTAVAPDRWVIRGTQAELLAIAGQAEMPAPTLIPVGTTSQDRELLVELEASGVVTVVGPPDQTLGLLRALAVATATAPWSEQSRVLLVGLHGELVDLPWVTPVPRLAEAIEAAEGHVDRTTTALWSLRCQSTAQARAAGITPEAWESLVVVSAVPPNDLGERQRVAALAEQPRKAVAFVAPQTGGQAPLGRTFTIGPDGWVRIDGVDVAVWPHRLEEADAGIVVALLDLAAQREDVPLTEPASAGVRLPPPPRNEDVSTFPGASGWSGLETDDGQPFADAPVEPVELTGDDRLPDDDRRLVHTTTGDELTSDELTGEELTNDELTGEELTNDELGEPIPTGEALEADAADDEQLVAGPMPEPVAVAPEPAPVPVRRLDALLDEIDVLVRVLGEVEAVRREAGTGTEERLVPVRQKALEAITYLALRESTVDREDLEVNLFPDGANAAKTVYNTVSAARNLVGEALFPPIEGGRYTLSERVVTDYGLFCDLVAQADETEDALLAADLLTDALSLVRGEPFTGVGRSYAWVGPHRGMIVAQVVDAAEELAEVRLAMNDWRAAEWAARRGLRAFPSDERMYRLLMRAARAAGNVPGVQRVFRELCDVIADPDLGVEPEDTLHPETVALLEELTGTPRHGQKGA